MIAALFVETDGVYSTFPVHSLALHSRWLVAKADLEDAHRARRDAEDNGEVTAEILDRIVKCEELVAQAKAELDACEAER